MVTFKRGRDEIRIEQQEYKGQQLIGLRKWYQDESGEWKPTREGINLKPEELEEAIAELQRIKALLSP